MTFIEHCRTSHSLPDICCPNEECHLTLAECRGLYKEFCRSYISSTNFDAQIAFDKITRFIDDMAKRSS